MDLSEQSLSNTELLLDVLVPATPIFNKSLAQAIESGTVTRNVLSLVTKPITPYTVGTIRNLNSDLPLLTEKSSYFLPNLQSRTLIPSLPLLREYLDTSTSKPDTKLKTVSSTQVFTERDSERLLSFSGNPKQT